MVRTGLSAREDLESVNVLEKKAQTPLGGGGVWHLDSSLSPAHGCAFKSYASFINVFSPRPRNHLESYAGLWIPTWTLASYSEGHTSGVSLSPKPPVTMHCSHFP